MSISQTANKPAASAESTLEGLLKEHRDMSTRPESTGSADREDCIQLFRERLAGELIGELENLAQKLEPQGVRLNWHLASVLQGGKELSFEFSFADHQLVLRGTLVRDAIAFQEVRGRGGSNSDLRSGPLLRLKPLTAVVLREFICTQVAGLVRSVIREQRASV